MLRKMIVLSVVVLALSGIFPQSSESQTRGWGWIKRLPVSHYSAEDSAIFHAHVDQALGEAENGERVEWSNPDSGHSGAITPLTTEQLKGLNCRQARFESQADQAQNISEFLLCQQPDGSWSVQSR